MANDYSGAPKENIVQNHLKIALLKVFQYLNGGYGHIFIPYKFFICSDFLAESLVIGKLQGSKLTCSKISARKKAPENFRRPFQGKNLLKMGNFTIFQMFENPRRGRQARNFTTNVPKILNLKSSSEQIFFRKLSLGAPGYSLSAVIFQPYTLIENG